MSLSITDIETATKRWVETEKHYPEHLKSLAQGMIETHFKTLQSNLDRLELAYLRTRDLQSDGRTTPAVAAVKS